MNRLATFAAVMLSASVLVARGQLQREEAAGLDITPPNHTSDPQPAPEPAPRTNPTPTGIDIEHAVPPPATRPGSTAPADNGPLLTMRPNQEATVAGMLGSVNEVPIFATDLFKALDPQLKQLAQNARSVGEFRTMARRLIADKLNEVETDAVILSAADAALTSDERSKIDLLVSGERIQFISSKGGSEAAAEKWLRAQNPPSNLAQWTADRKIQLKKEIYFSRNIGRNIEISRDMAFDAWRSDPKRWDVKAQIQLFQITIPASRWLRETKANGDVGEIPRNATPEQVKAAEAEAMKVAKDIVKKLRAGGDFARLAEEYHSADEYLTNGGKWPKPLEKGALVDKKMESYLFSLPAKSIQDPYLNHDEKYPYSDIIIFKTGEKTEARSIPFTEAQSTIVGELRQAQIRKLQQKKMLELMSTAAVEALERNIEMAVNVAVTRYATR